MHVRPFGIEGGGWEKDVSMMNDNSGIDHSDAYRIPIFPLSKSSVVKSPT